MRDLSFLRVDELLANAEARVTVEARYFDGHPVLFPDIAGAFEAQLKQSQQIAVMAMRLAELDGVKPMVEPDPDALGRRAAELLADLVEPARSDALEKLGEGESAFRIARDWLEGRFERPAIKVLKT